MVWQETQHVSGNQHTVQYMSKDKIHVLCFSFMNQSLDYSAAVDFCSSLSENSFLLRPSNAFEAAALFRTSNVKDLRINGIMQNEQVQFALITVQQNIPFKFQIDSLYRYNN